MRLHNTLTRQIDEFVPQTPGEVTLYTCGPTVYGYYHIGNLRNAVFNDTLRRTLAATGLKVKHVMNITDVGHLVADEDESVLSEDKLETGARREGKSVWAVAEHYTAAFKLDMAALNILPPSVDPRRRQNLAQHDSYARATDFIPEQIDLVQQLLDKGYAYQTNQAIYFDVTALADYGVLSGQKLADKEVAARSNVITDPAKHHPYDFAVWFFAVGHFAEHSMRWPSPWGEGFPGWHLECSAIIHGTLSDPIDLHTGGVDHIGTHHPNEMAQTEAAFGHSLARTWVHNEFMLVDGVKMAKSKGNSYTLADVVKRGFHPLALRLLYLQGHYRTELNFTWESLQAAQNRLLGLYAWADLVHQGSTTPPPVDAPGPGLVTPLANDLATPAALAELETWTGRHPPTPELLLELDQLLGLVLAGRPDITAAERALVGQRQLARQTKDWAAADALRAQLAEHQLEVNDTPAGPVWRRLQISPQMKGKS